MFGVLKKTWSHPLDRPKTSLTVAFIAWKLLLCLIAISSPGQGYDTSTFLRQPASKGLIGKFVRWDAIYFTQVAQHGYEFEQEWAFSYAFTRLLAFISNGIIVSSFSDPGNAAALAGIFTAQLSHWLSVLVLYAMTQAIFRTKPEVSQVAMISAALHIVSPAGLFLSAPCAESLFSLLQFSGYYFYMKCHEEDPVRRSLQHRVNGLSSGAILGLATSIRSNGLLNGVLFASDAINGCIELIRTRGSRSSLEKLVLAGIGGLCTLLGAVLPQVVAYREYCVDITGRQKRPWCDHLVPSIYAWVQSHYWNVGFLRYWTLSNVPLFILAAPMLVILVQSAAWTWTGTIAFSTPRDGVSNGKAASTNANKQSDSIMGSRKMMRLLSMPQLALALLALTNYHVQIITRLSSGYPLWYWWLAVSIIANQDRSLSVVQWAKPQVITRWMVIYAVIQGGLFASFLPPA
ncbi:ER membrane glycoprotein subunit of the GPI transamidase complex-like protein [Lambiella insularis]|nr:ER membrane glycoprotein subunit of the GPI transamidase complex-like protein [Lambiella insularis]